MAGCICAGCACGCIFVLADFDCWVASVAYAGAISVGRAFLVLADFNCEVFAPFVWRAFEAGAIVAGSVAGLHAGFASANILGCAGVAASALGCCLAIAVFAFSACRAVFAFCFFFWEGDWGLAAGNAGFAPAFSCFGKAAAVEERFCGRGLEGIGKIEVGVSLSFSSRISLCAGGCCFSFGRSLFGALGAREGAIGRGTMRGCEVVDFSKARALEGAGFWSGCISGACCAGGIGSICICAEGFCAREGSSFGWGVAGGFTPHSSFSFSCASSSFSCVSSSCAFSCWARFPGRDFFRLIVSRARLLLENFFSICSSSLCCSCCSLES